MAAITRMILFTTLLALAACTTTGHYTGNEFYYTVAGVHWSCREPKAYRGGNCKPESEWPDNQPKRK